MTTTTHMLAVGRAREIHAKVARLGIRMSALVSKSKISTLDTSIYNRVVGVADDAPEEEWIAAARFVHAVDPATAVGGLSETTQYIAAAVAEELGLFYASRQTIMRTRDKHEMRRVLRAAGLDTTASRIVADSGEVRAFAEEQGYPVVLKPRDGQGKMGFSLLRGPDDIPAALERFATQSAHSDILVEEFLEGVEYSVEAFSERGEHRTICVTKKYKDPDTFIEIGHCVPAPVNPGTAELLKRHVLRVLDALGVTDGPSHTEIMLNREGPTVVETHARLPGGAVVNLIDLVAGVDLDELWIRQLAGESVLSQVPRQLSGCAASAFAVPKGPGTVRRIDGKQEAEAQPGIAEVRLIFEPGTEISGIYDSDSRGAGVLARGDTSQQAVDRSRAALNLLTFEIS